MSEPASAAVGRVPRRAGLLSAAALLYASACGGPYGTEDFVARSGPGLLILLQVLAAGLWGIPLALATAELSARRPIEGGYYRWVREYMGEYWGFQAGAWSLMSSFLDNALYPALFAGVLPYFVPGLGAVGDVPIETFAERFTTTLAGRGGGDAARAAAHLLSGYLEWSSRQS